MPIRIGLDENIKQLPLESSDQFVCEHWNILVPGIMMNV